MANYAHEQCLLNCSQVNYTEWWARTLGPEQKKLPRYTQYIQSNFVDLQFVYFDSRFKTTIAFPHKVQSDNSSSCVDPSHIHNPQNIYSIPCSGSEGTLSPPPLSFFLYPSIPLSLIFSFLCFSFSVSFSLYTYALQSWIGRTFGTAFGMNPEVGGSSPHWVEIFLSQKLSEDHPFVSQKWMLLPVCSWHFKC